MGTLSVLLIYGAIVGVIHAVCKTTLTTEEQVLIDKHNELRRLHKDTPDLCYGETGSDITFSANIWNDQLASDKTMSHSDSQDYNSGPISKSNYYGENLAGAGTTGTVAGETAAFEASTEAWYDEIQYWNFENSESTDSDKATGHFTQVVWKDTQQVNCAYATYVKDEMNWYIVTCQYYPGGNWQMEGEYAANVQPLIDSSGVGSKPSVILMLVIAVFMGLTYM